MIPLALMAATLPLLLSEFSVLCNLGGKVQYLVHDGGGNLVVLVVVELSLLCLVLFVEGQVMSLIG